MPTHINDVLKAEHEVQTIYTEEDLKKVSTVLTWPPSKNAIKKKKGKGPWYVPKVAAEAVKDVPVLPHDEAAKLTVKEVEAHLQSEYNTNSYYYKHVITPMLDKMKSDAENSTNVEPQVNTTQGQPEAITVQAEISGQTTAEPPINAAPVHATTHLPGQHNHTALLHMLPADFEPREYLRLNPDLTRAGIMTEESAKLHYVSFGNLEKRKYKQSPKAKQEVKAEAAEVMVPEGFDWQEYLALNLDLVPKGITTKEAAEQHFLNHGVQEKRWDERRGARTTVQLSQQQ